MEGIKSILETEIGFKIIESCESFVTNDLQIEELHPDIALMDISKCEEECLKVLKKIHDKTVKTIAITGDKAPIYLGELIELGIYGFVLKDSLSEFLIPALNKANDGGFYHIGQARKSMTRVCRCSCLAHQSGGILKHVQLLRGACVIWWLAYLK